jgi:hypothetical protein
MFVQMRIPFSGRWLKIDAEDGTIDEVAWGCVPGYSALTCDCAAAAPSTGPETAASQSDRCRRERGCPVPRRSGRPRRP